MQLNLILMALPAIAMCSPAIDGRCAPNVIGCWSLSELYFDGWMSSKMNGFGDCMFGPGQPQDDAWCLQCYDFFPRRYFDDPYPGWHSEINLRDFAVLQNRATFVRLQFEAAYDCSPRYEQWDNGTVWPIAGAVAMNEE